MATPVLMPRQGQSVESCILVDWLVAAGDSVEAGQPLASIETDKAVFEVESPAAGTVVELFFEAGDDIPVLTHIAAVGDPGEDVSDLKPDGAAAPAAEDAPEEAAASAAAAAPTPEPQTAPAGAAVGVSPRARQLAAQTGVNTAGLPGTGPAGRVIERDVAAAAAAAPRMTGSAREAAATRGLAAPAQGSGPGGMVLSGDLGAPAAQAPAVPVAEPTTIPLTGIRKLIAERMHQSLASTAQLTLNMSFDATALLDYRKQVKQQGEGYGLPNITLNDMIVFAVSRALLRHPDLNAHFLGDRTVQYHEAHIGVATDTPRGLMVPVLHGASRRSLPEISRDLKPILEAAQSGSVDPDLLQGGTFTITNMGMLGVESFTPILNAPEVAILGVGGLVLKPVMKDGAVTHVQSITLSLTIDHQTVDGAPGARFLQDLCRSLENFALALTAG